jgi:hypothetical protein
MHRQSIDFERETDQRDGVPLSTDRRATIDIVHCVMDVTAAAAANRDSAMHAVANEKGVRAQENEFKMAAERNPLHRRRRRRRFRRVETLAAHASA